MFCHSFESGNDIFLFNKNSFTVYLSKFRLTVGTKIFITETLYNLEVTIKAGNHQQLLQCLETVVVHKLSWFIREGTTKSRAPSGVEPTNIGVSTSRNPFAVQISTHLHCHSMTEFQIFTHTITA